MILVDSGYFVALAVAADADHAAATAEAKRLDEPLITTWPVVTETSHFLLARSGAAAVLSFVEALSQGSATLFDLRSGHLPRMHELIEKYRDQPMDLADASLVVVAEEIGSGRILTTDRRDFGVYRWKDRRVFRNLLG